MNISFKKIVQDNHATILIIILAGFLSFCLVLGGPFKMMDDEVSILNNENVKNLSQFVTILKTPFFNQPVYYRPLVTISFMLEYFFIEENPFYYHLTNLILHILNAILAFYLIDVISSKRMVSFFAALLFVMHPIQWEAIGNIAGRSIILCTFFYFLSLTCYLRATAKKKISFYYILSASCFILSLLSKESAITFPLAVLFYEIIFLNIKAGFNARVKEGFKKTWVFYLISLLYFLWRRILHITAVAYWGNLKEAAFGFATFLRSLITYFRLMVLPIDLHFDRSVQYFNKFYSYELLVTLGILFAAIILIVKLYKKWPKYLNFFMIFSTVALLPTAQLFPIRAHADFAAAADHFVYLPSLGLFVIFVVFFRYIIDKLTVQAIVSRATIYYSVIGYFTFLFIFSISQSLIARNELAMYRQTLKFNPVNTRIRTSYALALAKHKMFKDAGDEFQAVVNYEPFNARARIGLGKALIDQGQLLEGIEQYEKVEDQTGFEELLQNNITTAYNLLIKQYERLISLEPFNSQAYYSLGVVYAKQGKIQEGIMYFEKAISIDPRNKNALYNLATSYDALGDTKQAQHYFESVVLLEGKKDNLDGYSYKRLAEISFDLGDNDKAAEYFRQSREIELATETNNGN